jgi:hypothetical protein
MARFVYPSSFVCDCGHQSHFFENTVREAAANSLRRRKNIELLDSEAEEHAIEFAEGHPVAITCPRLGCRQIDG